jgi:peptide/nickel transport system substrate-binding protein
MQRALVALALLLASCAVAPNAATPAPSPVQTGGSLRVAVAAEITSLDPWAADAASLVATRQIFETLVGADTTTGAIIPGLASAWHMANDGATWTFTLRDRIRFQDGSSLDASAVVASFEHGQGSRSYAMLFDEPSEISRVSAVDSRTVRFDLRAPFGPFLAHLAAPQTAIAHGGSGTGPFLAKTDALAPDGTLTLERNDAYWQRNPAGLALPYLAGLVLRPVRDPASRLAELRAGRVDVALELPVAQALATRGDPNLVLALRPYAALASLGIDITATPFDRSEIRRAVAMSLDRSALGSVYGGTLRPATQVVPPGSLAFDTSVAEFAPFDAGAAKRMVAETHLALPIAADFVYPSAPTAAYPDPQRIAQSLAADLLKIGVVARLRAVDPAAIRSAKATFALETTPVGLDPDDVFWPLFGDQDPSNTSLVVGLLRKARAEADPSKRAELYKQVSKISRTDVTRVPLLFADRPSAASARIVGYSGESVSFGTVWLRP